MLALLPTPEIALGSVICLSGVHHDHDICPDEPRDGEGNRHLEETEND
jgi:hypothetical protein